MAMCGFCGFTGLINERNSHQVLMSMMDTMIHRGPDGGGIYIDDEISLGFRRLSIIDLESGSQPITNESDDLILTFNGEIYNYQQLRDDLIHKGHSFKTKTDAEVVLHGFEEYGKNLLNLLRGMFAFVIWDKNSTSLFGARDFFGIKPFYYTNVNGNIIFASEIKSILKHPNVPKELNPSALEHYLSFQYSPLEETFFKNIYKLPPAHYFTFRNGKMEINRYWQFSFYQESEVKSLDEYVTSIENIMKDSVEMHKVSDVEVGSFLSSGIDSSYIAALFNGNKTFTIGFDFEQYSEITEANRFSSDSGLRNFNKIVSAREYWAILPKVQYFMDEPLADPAAIALYFVSQLASQHVKVVLSGEGADELFGGYNIYKEPLSLKPMNFLPRILRQFIGKLASYLPIQIKGRNYLIRAGKSLEERFIGNAYIFNEKEKKSFLRKEFVSGHSLLEVTRNYYDMVKDKDDITKMQFLDVHLWLTGDILLKADKMSMAHSLELRVPFLDKEVAKIASRLPTKFRVNKQFTKYALRLAAKKKINEDVANKKKLGFPVPIRIWLKEENYYKIVRESFLSDNSNLFFHKEWLLRLLDDHYRGKKDNSRKIWTIYMFLLWYEQYFKSF